MTINNDNIELLIFRLNEGLLDDAERAMVEKALAENRNWKEIADEYDPKVQMPHYPHLVYHDKEKLHAIARPARQIIIPIWSRVAAACAIIIAVALFIRIYNNDNSDDIILASNNTNESVSNLTNESPLTDIHKSDKPNNPSTINKLGLNKNQSSNKHGLEKSNTTNEHGFNEYASDNEHSSEISNEFNAISNNTAQEFITFIDNDDTTYNYLIAMAGESRNTDETSDNSDKTSDNGIIYTNHLISFIDDIKPKHSIPYTPHPEWRTTIEDWSSKLQIARLELQTNMVTRLSRKLKNDN